MDYNQVDLAAYLQSGEIIGDGTSFANELRFKRTNTPFRPAAAFDSPFADAMGIAYGYHNMIPLSELTDISLLEAISDLQYRENAPIGGVAQTFWGGMDWGITANG